METLATFLCEEQDADYAFYLLAVTLGICEHSMDAWYKNKAEFCSNTELNQLLHSIMFKLVDAGLVLWQNGGFRWNPDVKPLSS
jgi:hypothetical protein